MVAAVVTQVEAVEMEGTMVVAMAAVAATAEAVSEVGSSPRTMDLPGRRPTSCEVSTTCQDSICSSWKCRRPQSRFCAK